MSLRYFGLFLVVGFIMPILHLQLHLRVQLVVWGVVLDHLGQGLDDFFGRVVFSQGVAYGGAGPLVTLLY